MNNRLLVFAILLGAVIAGVTARASDQGKPGDPRVTGEGITYERSPFTDEVSRKGPKPKRKP